MGWKAQSFPSLYRSVVGFVHFHGRTQAQTAFCSAHQDFLSKNIHRVQTSSVAEIRARKYTARTQGIWPHAVQV